MLSLEWLERESIKRKPLCRNPSDLLLLRAYVSCLQWRKEPCLGEEKLSCRCCKKDKNLQLMLLQHEQNMLEKFFLFANIFTCHGRDNVSVDLLMSFEVNFKMFLKGPASRFTLSLPLNMESFHSKHSPLGSWVVCETINK